MFAALAVALLPWQQEVEVRVFPLLSRSERVERAVPTARGILLRVDGPAGDLEVGAVSHAVDHQVLVSGGKTWLVGPPRLPSRADAPGDRSVLPELARRDGVAVPLEDVDLGVPPNLPENARMVAIAADGSVELRAPSTTSPTHPGRWVDQLFLASVTPLAAESFTTQEVLTARPRDGSGTELRLATPEAREGKTWTFVVRSRPGAGPRPAVHRSGSEPEAGFLRDVAAELGAGWSHLEGPDEQLDIRPTMGPGAAWGDVDADGWVDLYLVQGAGREGCEPIQNRLLLNRGGDGFVDATGSHGGGDDGAGMGALFLDADGDGFLDLYVANYGVDALFANDGHGKLADVTAAAGVTANLWSAGVAASDYDADGDLDLYVTSYLRYDESLMPHEDELERYRREDPVAMLPFAFPGERNVLLRNDVQDGPLRFVDVAEEKKLRDEIGRGMQPVFWDFDRDRDDDLYVANDVSYNLLWRNEGDATFRDVSFSTGMDDPRGGMGVAIGDVEGDGDEDLFLTNWQLEANALYANNLISHRSQRHRVATFRDVIVPSGLGAFGVGFTSWGCELFDAECDGDLDLFVANGYTSPDYESTGICVGQPNHFFRNDGEGRFADASGDAGAALARPLPSRCAVACDFDRDGDVDLVVTANNGPVQLLRNELPTDRKGAWLLVRLRGAGRNTHAIGAEVTIRAGELLLRRTLRAGTSYLGGNPPELHFGLGEVAGVDSLTVRWPSGRESMHPIAAINTLVTLEEPE